jgi:xanthine dehydrogenase YagS FAD-binding subunit
MTPFQYDRPVTIANATRRVGGAPTATFIAGGTTLVDLMKLNVLAPHVLVDIGSLPLSGIAARPDRIRLGATARNSDIAAHPAIRERVPVLAEALLAGASPQLRNMATLAGNLLQRTRCPYYRDVHSACNKRDPGSGCSALTGINRDHAILGGSEQCIAVFPSDACTALAILDAVVHTVRPNGTTRSIPFERLHVLPGNTPERETILEHGELITEIDLPDVPVARRSTYRKVRDRASYEFALASAAVALQIEEGTILAARVALGGIATKPWRALAAERVLVGSPPTVEVFQASAQAALAGARPYPHNAFKVDLAQRTLVRALRDLAADSGSTSSTVDTS